MPDSFTSAGPVKERLGSAAVATVEVLNEDVEGSCCPQAVRHSPSAALRCSMAVITHRRESLGADQQLMNSCGAEGSQINRQLELSDTSSTLPYTSCWLNNNTSAIHAPHYVVTASHAPSCVACLASIVLVGSEHAVRIEAVCT